LRVIDEWKPDAAVFDILFFPGIIAAELRGLPYASSCPVPSPLPSRDLLPYAFGFPSRQRRMNWLERAMNGCSEWYWGLNTRYVNRVRTHLGLAPIKHLISSGLSPYLYLSYTTSRFEFARSDLPAQVYYIGPARSLPAAAAAEFPWDRFGRDPVVYFTMGTLQGDRKVIRRMIEASSGAPWQTVIAIGRLFTVDSFGQLPANVLLLNWVPQAELMKRVAAVVCHGGFNTVNDALAEGVPLLVLPQAWDHFETAQRVVEAGAGLRLNRPQVSAPALRENTRRLLETASYREAARRLAEDFARCDAARTGADLVLRLAETRQPLLRKPAQEPTVYVEPQFSLG
jgi:MGT family glycosyltransferase